MSAQPHGRTVYFRYTDVNGKVSLAEHRTWSDDDRLLKARQADAERENGKQKPGEPRRAKVEQISIDQYKQGR